MKRGYIAQALISLVLGIGGCLVSLFANPWRATAVVVASGALLYWVRHRARRRRLVQIQEMGAGRWLLRRSRQLLLRRFQQAGLSPAPADTVRHLLAKLASGNGPQATALAAFIGEYEQLRYGPDQPSAEAVLRFEQRLRHALRRPAGVSSG